MSASDTSGALRRYRVAAWVVGVLLLILTAGVVLKYGAGQPIVVSVVGPLHGFCYIGYLVLAFDLMRRVRWPLGRVLLVLLAGTVPLLSFVVERWVTRSLTRRASLV